MKTTLLVLAFCIATSVAVPLETQEEANDAGWDLVTKEVEALKSVVTSTVDQIKKLTADNVESVGKEVALILDPAHFIVQNVIAEMNVLIARKDLKWTEVSRFSSAVRDTVYKAKDDVKKATEILHPILLEEIRNIFGVLEVQLVSRFYRITNILMNIKQ